METIKARCKSGFSILQFTLTVFDMGKIKESFSAGEAAKITGVPYRNLDHWARTKFIVPSISEAKRNWHGAKIRLR